MVQTNDTKVYNWWIDDDAPKVRIYAGSMQGASSKVRVNTNIEILRHIGRKYDEMLQAGIYIHTYADKKNYICGVEGEEKWILDRVGYDGQCQNVNCRYDISVEITKSDIVYKILNGDSEKNLSQKINAEAGLEVGLICKTWNKPSNVRVYFRNTEVIS